MLLAVLAPIGGDAQFATPIDAHYLLWSRVSGQTVDRLRTHGFHLSEIVHRIATAFVVADDPAESSWVRSLVLRVLRDVTRLHRFLRRLDVERIHDLISSRLRRAPLVECTPHLIQLTGLHEAGSGEHFRIICEGCASRGPANILPIRIPSTPPSDPPSGPMDPPNRRRGMYLPCRERSSRGETCKQKPKPRL